MPLFGKIFAASIFFVLYDNITPYIKFGAFVRCVNVTQKFSLKLPYYKWRIITDLSFPHGQSVNDGIDPSFCSLCYTTVDEVAARVAHLGRGTLLAKIDIESAYWLLPVHPHDRPLQQSNGTIRSMLMLFCLLGHGQQQRFLTQ